MNYNPTAKSEFIKNENVCKIHRSLVERPELRAGINVAMLEMSRQICNNAPADNMGACAASHLRMLGAQDFAQIFLNLAETEVAPRRVETGNLPGNVSQMPRKN